ncbi:MAG TPA: DUF4402 domain-containing protein [Sphingomicrobium sp.]
MKNFARLAALAVIATAAATPAVAADGDPKAKASVKVTKPLTLAAEQDLNFGEVILVGDTTIKIDTSGNVDCGDPVNATCNDTGAQEARYRVTGSNNQQVTITTPASTLGRVGGGGSVAFRPVVDTATITLPNSGATGMTFNVGGEIDLFDDTPGGDYEGDIEVTVQY